MAEEKVRIDKWLWAARFFKTRALASRACDLGRILLAARQKFHAVPHAVDSTQSTYQPVKPARDVCIGDMLRITNEGGEFEVEVLLLSEIRGPAAVAQTLYRETDASHEARLKASAERRAAREWEQLPAGRPNKRDRRRIIQFRGGR